MLNRGEESDHIINMEWGTEAEVVPTQLLQQTLGASLADQGVEALHRQHKEHGERGSPC
jgi:hypothetical protein